MKRSTAIGHLVEMAEVATEQLGFRASGIGWPLEEMWVTGDLLGPADTLDVGAVVLVIDVPPAEVPWLARHPIGEAIGEQLRLGKRPMLWSYRPLAWPVWSAGHRRLVRFWSASGGIDTAVIEALRSHQLGELPLVEPTDDDFVAQLREELAASRRHLRTVLEHYWEPTWRRDHKGYDESPEDHLWRAATAVTDIVDILDGL